MARCFQRGSWAMVPALLIACVLIHASALVHVYGLTDDYPALRHPGSPPGLALHPFHSAAGRPLLGILLPNLFGLADTVADLRWIRLLGLTFTAALAWASLSFARCSGMSGWSAWLLGLLVATVPGSALFVAWASCFAYPLAALLALLAAYLVLREGRLAWRLPAALCLLLLALCIYQPAACAFPVFCFIGLYPKSAPDSASLRRAALGLGAFCLALLLYFIAYQAWAPGSADNSSPVQRSALTHDYLDKLAFLLTDVLPRLFSGWWSFLVTGEPALQVLVLIPALAAGAFPWLDLRSRGRRKRPFLWLALWAFCLALSIVSVWGLAHNDGSFRLLYPASILVAATHLFAAQALLDRQTERHRWVGRAFLALVVGTHVAGASFITYLGIVRPQTEEFERMQAHLVARFDHPPPFVVFLHPPSELPGFSRVPRQAEFGFPSTALPWVPRNLIPQIFEERFPRTEFPTEVLQFYPGEAHHLQPTWPIIDGSSVLIGQPARAPASGPVNLSVQHPELGPCQTFWRDWFFTPGLGYLRLVGQRVFFPDYGWFDWNGKLPDGSFVIERPHTPPLTLRADRFPLVTLPDGSEVDLGSLAEPPPAN